MNLILDITDGSNGAAVNISVTPFDEHPLKCMVADVYDLAEGLGRQLAVLDGVHLVEFVFDKEIPTSTIDATAGTLRGIGLVNAANAWAAAHRNKSVRGIDNVIQFRGRSRLEF